MFLLVGRLMGKLAQGKNGVMNRADWVTLRDYVDSRFDALCAEMAKSDEVMNARLSSMNEFRQAMSDQSKNYFTRAEAILSHKVYDDELRESRDFRSSHQGKASQGQLWFVSGISILGVILGLIHLFTK
jgi:hypothetical protein